MSVRTEKAEPFGQIEFAILITNLIFLVAVIGMVGCGPKSNLLGVAGEVTLDGTPVKSGSIEFTSVGSEKLFASGAPIRDGRYEIPQAKGLPPGKYLVVLSAPQASSTPGGAGMEMMPLEYNAMSKVTVDLSPDSDNHFPFDVVTKK